MSDKVLRSGGEENFHEFAETLVYRETLRRCQGETERFPRIREAAPRFLPGSPEILLAGVIWGFCGCAGSATAERGSGGAEYGSAEAELPSAGAVHGSAAPGSWSADAESRSAGVKPWSAAVALPVRRLCIGAQPYNP